MRRFCACLSVAAIVLALISAPFVHFHDQDDDHDAPIIHAHFEEPEHSLADSHEAVESHHSHQHARWIDLFVLKASPTAVFWAVTEFSETVETPRLELRGVSQFIGTVRAHGPPGARPSIPRSPPAI